MNETMSPGGNNNANWMTQVGISASKRRSTTGIFMVLASKMVSVGVQYWTLIESGTGPLGNTPEKRVVGPCFGAAEQDSRTIAAAIKIAGLFIVA